MAILIPLAVFLGSLALLVWAAGVFIRSAEAVGLRLGLSPFVVGITVVAFGTSLPELIASVTSVYAGVTEIAVGTAVGSNITNILLILGLAALIGRGMKVDYDLLRVDLPFLFGSALALWMFGYDGTVGPIEGLVSLGVLAVYVAYAAATPEEPGTSVAASAVGLSAEVQELRAEAETLRRRPLSARVWGALVLSAVATQVGAHFTVDSLIQLSAGLQVGAEIIATTALALGTSLPELVVSARSARQGKPEIAIGNVIGSNVFNALGVVGASALFGTLTVPVSLENFALPAMLGVTVLAFFVLQEGEMTVWDGFLLLALYVGFLVQVSRLDGAGA